MELKEIPGFNGHYGVTIDGQVWSYRLERFLKPTLNSKRYCVKLYKDGVPIGYLIHRLIMSAWGDLDLDDTKLVVHHINEDPSDNRLENLQIISDYDHKSHHNHINAKGYNINSETHKVCTKCEILKLRSEFSVNLHRLDGLHSWCKSCNKLYYQQNKEAILQRERRR